MHKYVFFEFCFPEVDFLISAQLSLSVMHPTNRMYEIYHHQVQNTPKWLIQFDSLAHACRTLALPVNVHTKTCAAN